jgi:hypothetical protein
LNVAKAPAAAERPDAVTVEQAARMGFKEQSVIPRRLFLASQMALIGSKF